MKSTRARSRASTSAPIMLPKMLMCGLGSRAMGMPHTTRSVIQKHFMTSPPGEGTELSQALISGVEDRLRLAGDAQRARGERVLAETDADGDVLARVSAGPLEVPEHAQGGVGGDRVVDRSDAAKAPRLFQATPPLERLPAEERGEARGLEDGPPGRDKVVKHRI